jgi:hypothetical protein
VLWRLDGRIVKLLILHIGTGPHGFPLIRVDEVQATTDMETASPQLLLEELARLHECVEVIGELPEPPAAVGPGWDPVGDLLRESAHAEPPGSAGITKPACPSCGAALEDGRCGACAVAGGGI